MSNAVPDASGWTGTTNVGGDGVASVGACDATSGLVAGTVKGSRPIACAREGEF